MNDAHSTPLEPGTWFAERFELVRRLGHGAFGVVYEARMHPVARRVALKVLHADVVGSSEVAIRFVREARILGELEHPHIVSVLDVGRSNEGVPYIAMELLDGEPLGARMKREGPMGVHEALALWIPLCSALASVHERGVVHRDIKPDNVMLARLSTGQVLPKLLDFGIAKADVQDGAGTQTRSVMGTPRYMSPEQAMDSKNIDARSDQWSMAVMLWEMLAGRRLFVGPHQVAVLNAVLEAPIPDIRTLASVPDGLALALHRALQRDPDARHADMLAFGRAVLPHASERTLADWRAVFSVALLDTATATIGAQTPTPPLGVDPTQVVVRPVTFMGAPPPETLQPASRGVPTEAPRSSRNTVLAAVLAAAAAVSAVGLQRRAEAPPPRPTTAPTFTLDLVVDPPGAQLALDGAPAVVGPLHRALPRDGRAHVVVVTAPGFESQTLTFADVSPPSHVALRAVPPSTTGAVRTDTNADAGPRAITAPARARRRTAAPAPIPTPYDDLPPEPPTPRHPNDQPVF